jgi:hypothetical protein
VTCDAISYLDIRDFTSDLRNLSCDFVAQNPWVTGDEARGVFHDDDRQPNACGPDPNQGIARTRGGLFHFCESDGTAEFVKQHGAH